MKSKSIKGSAMVLVILFLGVFMILASSLTGLAITNYNTGKIEARNQYAFYIGEACLEETKTLVLLRLQAFINQGKGKTNPGQFNKFMDDLSAAADEVINLEIISALGADWVDGESESEGNTILFSYTAVFEGSARTLSAEYVFDDPDTYVPGDIAMNKVTIIWRKSE